MLIALAITSAPLPRDTTASIIISLAHRLIAEMSVSADESRGPVRAAWWRWRTRRRGRPPAGRYPGPVPARRVSVSRNGTTSFALLRVSQRRQTLQRQALQFGNRAAHMSGLPVRARSVMAAAFPLGESGWQVMTTRLPGCEPDGVMDSHRAPGPPAGPGGEQGEGEGMPKPKAAPRPGMAISPRRPERQNPEDT